MRVCRPVWARTAEQGRRPAAVAASVLAVVLLVSGCSAGADATSSGGSFDFVAPGGRTDIFYDPPETRGIIGELAGPDLMEEGKNTALSDYGGDVVVINLWGQWCGPCRGEADDLEEVFESTKDSGVQFLGINVRDPQKDKAQDFVVDNNVSYPSIYDPSMRTLIALGGNYPTSVIPSTLVLDREHRVAAVFMRALLTEDLLPVVERIAAE
ncbi:TlpA family protein disulfide reductase [Rhodococcus sp. PAMC28707]|uniref:TlpA disulfide reductase family protein n=1 Tax=unclassified Rhodococcus (in: high G+C Gram-positive bacteria) TaxID=192944 RepID=UPI00109E2CDB|nr:MULTISPECIES: TlpA disulfide reductase family protein [unclassified Rhodococcus (in: high G+C Gram-positive bacteria)]QCB51308.1 TlpA family protein disulfide reductase [Rhodococcus sp. PAMC28705]QCB60524.1 TlpA family protein disulfide reductase [Rhodococcus sp. PAMC28707]